MKKVPFIVGLIIVLMFALTTLSLAQTINACYSNRNGTLRIVSDSSQCTKNETPITLLQGFDSTNYYFKECTDLTIGQCFCDNTTDSIITGGAFCPPPVSLQYWALYVSQPLLGGSLPGWAAGCVNVDTHETTPPLYIWIGCLRQ